MDSLCRILRLAFLIWVLAACGDDDDNGLQTIADAVADDTRFSSLAQALVDTGLRLVPAGPVGGLTVPELRDLLLYHKIDGSLVLNGLVRIRSCVAQWLRRR